MQRRTLGRVAAAVTAVAAIVMALAALALVTRDDSGTQSTTTSVAAATTSTTTLPDASTTTLDAELAAELRAVAGDPAAVTAYVGGAGKVLVAFEEALVELSSGNEAVPCADLMATLQPFSVAEVYQAANDMPDPMLAEGYAALQISVAEAATACDLAPGTDLDTASLEAIETPRTVIDARFRVLGIRQ